MPLIPVNETRQVFRASQREYQIRCVFAYADFTAMAVIEPVPSFDTLHTYEHLEQR
jgi:hypothetical protein